MHFLAENFHWGLSDFNEMTWKMRKEFIEFHQKVLEERKNNQG